MKLVFPSSQFATSLLSSSTRFLTSRSQIIQHLAPASPLLSRQHRHIHKMPPPPKRKWHRPRGDRANGTPGNATGNPATTNNARAPFSQQPKRPKVEEMAAQDVGQVDVKQMYSTSAGEATAKPFSALSGTLDKTLLDGLAKMGFE